MSETTQPIKEAIPQSYCLSEADFKVELTEIHDYHIGDRVIRENFCSLLILSFAVSKTKYFVQAAFFIWISKKTSFDYFTTLINLENSGGWHALSEKERQAFLSAFGRVEVHHTLKQDEKSIIAEFDRLSRELPLKDELWAEQKFFDFDRIENITQFVKAADGYFRYLKSDSVD